MRNPVEPFVSFLDESWRIGDVFEVGDRPWFSDLFPGNRDAVFRVVGFEQVTAFTHRALVCRLNKFERIAWRIFG